MSSSELTEELAKLVENIQTRIAALVDQEAVVLAPSAMLVMPDLRSPGELTSSCWDWAGAENDVCGLAVTLVNKINDAGSNESILEITS